MKLRKFTQLRGRIGTKATVYSKSMTTGDGCNSFVPKFCCCLILVESMGLVYVYLPTNLPWKSTIHGSVNIPFPWLLWGMLCWSIWYFELSSSKGLILLWDLGWWPTFIDFIESKITTEFTEEDWCFVSIWINPAGTNRSLDYVNPKRQSHQNHQTSQK